MANRAARDLLQYFRTTEKRTGTMGTTGTSENNAFRSNAYAGPGFVGLVPGGHQEREPQALVNGNRNNPAIQWLESIVPDVPVVPSRKAKGCAAPAGHRFDAERAAIIEFEAEVPRAWAEGFSRMLAMSRPAAVPEERWRLFIDDCGRFLDRWATQAAALGWQADDLFGWSTSGQLQQLDLAGLVWALEGQEIAALTAASATVRTGDAAHLTYRRSSGPRCRHQIPVWELKSDPEAAHKGSAQQ